MLSRRVRGSLIQADQNKLFCCSAQHCITAPNTARGYKHSNALGPACMVVSAEVGLLFVAPPLYLVVASIGNLGTTTETSSSGRASPNLASPTCMPSIGTQQIRTTYFSTPSQYTHGVI